MTRGQFRLGARATINVAHSPISLIYISHKYIAPTYISHLSYLALTYLSLNQHFASSNGRLSCWSLQILTKSIGAQLLCFQNQSLPHLHRHIFTLFLCKNCILSLTPVDFPAMFRFLLFFYLGCQTDSI